MVAPFKLDAKVTIERKTTARDPDYGTEIEAWEVVAPRIWANVQDVTPARAESTVEGLRIATQQTRLIIRNMAAITAEMRVTLHGQHGERVMQIVVGPVLLDDRLHTMFRLEGYSS